VGDRARSSRVPTRGRRARSIVAATVALIVLGLAIAGAPTGGGAAGAADSAATPVRHETLTLVDPSRPTEDPSAGRSAPDRTLVTEVYVPPGPGPFPIVVLAHGNNGNPGKLSQLLEAWAGAGYVVAAPAFPLTNDLSGGPSILADYVNQPADLSFVLDELLARSRRSTGPLAGRIDARRIGVAGFSLGGATVYGMAYNRCCLDRRIDAVLLMDAARLDFPGGAYRPIRGPVMFVHLRNDPLVPYRLSTESYAEAAPPKLLMTLERGIHPEPFENLPSPHDAAVIAATTAYWDLYLQRQGTIRTIVRAGTEPGLSTVIAER
jgi:dienelactone hydrolase